MDGNTKTGIMGYRPTQLDYMNTRGTKVPRVNIISMSQMWGAFAGVALGFLLLYPFFGAIGWVLGILLGTSATTLVNGDYLYRQVFAYLRVWGKNVSGNPTVITFDDLWNAEYESGNEDEGAILLGVGEDTFISM